MPGRGKSGSARVGYLYFVSHKWTILLTAFGKNEKANLTQAEISEFARWIKKIENLLPPVVG